MSIKASANIQHRISVHFDLFKIEFFQLDLYIPTLFPSRRVLHVLSWPQSSEIESSNGAAQCHKYC